MLKITLSILLLIAVTIVLVLAIPEVENLTQEAQATTTNTEEEDDDDNDQSQTQTQTPTPTPTTPPGPEAPAGERGNEDGDPTTAKMGNINDPNPSIVELASGGICQIDQKIEEQESRLGVDYSQPLKDKLKLETIRALNESAIASGYTGGNQGEQWCQPYDYEKLN